ncbi:MAG: RNA methyltransferase [Pseudomonadota bacterium]
MGQSKPPYSHDSDQYTQKKAFFNSVLTIYGRNSVLEALQQGLNIYRIHMAESNRPAAVLKAIAELAEKNHIEVRYHSKQALSRISKNSKQDQGVAADIACPEHQAFDDWNATHSGSALTILALDGIHNPQNLGMIIRSAAASGIHGILLSPQGNAKLGSLVIKASAGTVFKAPIVHCPDGLAAALTRLRTQGVDVIAMRADADDSIMSYHTNKQACYVLGNESHGVSREVADVCNVHLSIPMHNDVESLNVAVSASLICYAHHFNG